MFRGLLAGFSLILLLGVYFAGGVQLPVFDAQRAVVAELLKAVFAHLTPLSSLLGGGVALKGAGFQLSSSYGPLPVLSLALAGLLAGLMSRSLPQAVLAAASASMLVIITAIILLVGYVPTLANQAGILEEVDRVFSSIIRERPLDLPSILSIPVIASIPSGLVMERIWAAREEEQPSILGWRRRRLAPA